MGGGNGQKSATARARNQDKLAKAKGGKSQLADNAKAMSIKCHICLATFMSTTNEAKCKEHQENKHAKHDLYACFPHLKA